jgi:hypothetical protein
VSFCCDLCGGRLLYVHSWGDGRVELSVPGPRLSVLHRLREPSYIDQRATGIPVVRDGYERSPSVTKSGSVVVSCGRCGSRRHYDPIKRERLVADAAAAVRDGVERVRVTRGGALESEIEPGHCRRRSG